MFTDAQFRYNYTWFATTSSYVVFRAKSCADAHILLSSNFDETDNAYEIVYGCYDNTKTEIRRGSHGPILDSVETPDIMHCEEFRHFWVRWDTAEKTLTVGAGRLNEHQYLTIIDENLVDIKAFTFTSWDQEGEYQVTEDQGA